MRLRALVELEVTPLVPAWSNIAHALHMDGGIRVRFFCPRDTFGLCVRHDAWSLGIGLRYVVPTIRSLLDEIVLSHNHLLRLDANLLCQPR